MPSGASSRDHVRHQHREGDPLRQIRGLGIDGQDHRRPAVGLARGRGGDRPPEPTISSSPGDSVKTGVGPNVAPERSTPSSSAIPGAEAGDRADRRRSRSVANGPPTGGATQRLAL